MVVLVTGGAGYIGSICVDALTEREHKVLVIDNLQEGHREAVHSQAFFYEGDYGDRSLLKTIFAKHTVDAVIHFAADTRVEQSMSDPGRFFRNNVLNGITLLDVMRSYGCRRMIFSSTASIFGDPRYNPVDEKHPQVPINPYGESKLMFEKVLDWYHHAYGLRFNALRYFNAAGATDRRGDAKRNVTLLIPVTIQVLLGQRERLQIFGNDYNTKDGTCIRDYVHVVDLIDAHILALNTLEKYPNGKYNLGNGRGFTNLEVLKTVEMVSGKKVPFEYAARRPGDPVELVASSDLARRKLGWNPRYTQLEEIIASAWEWHQKHPNGYK